MYSHGKNKKCSTILGIQQTNIAVGEQAAPGSSRGNDTRVVIQTVVVV
jgi:hypothetical protein